MNKVTRFISAAAALMLVVVSCAKQELPVSTFKMDSTAIVVPAGGGICSVPYQVASSDAGETVEAVSPQNWVNGFDYSVDGVISFNVDPNEGTEDRNTTITVLYGNQTISLPVSQYKPSRVLASEIENLTLTATFCAFDRDKTIFRLMNPKSLGEPYMDPYGREYITAGQFANQYAQAYNFVNPDDPQTADDFLVYAYVEPTLDNNMTGSFFDVRFYMEGDKRMMSVSDGSYAPAGNAEVIRMAGEYTYDEEKGLIYLYDDSNTMEMYHKDVVISLKKDGRRYIFEIVETVQPEFWRPYLSRIMDETGIDLMTEPNFGFTLSNYTQTEFYMPFGSFVYTLKVMD